MAALEHASHTTGTQSQETISTRDIRTFLRDWRAWRAVAETREQEHDDQVLHLMDDAAEQAQAATTG